MKTTQGEAVKAFGTLTAISKEQVSSTTAYKLFKLKKALSTIIEFQSEQEVTLAEQCGGSVSDDGRLNFPDDESRMLYAAKHKELEEMECEIGHERMKMSLREIPRMTIQSIELLDPYIDFEE